VASLVFWSATTTCSHNPAILLATTHTSDPTSTHVPAGPTPYDTKQCPVVQMVLLGGVGDDVEEARGFLPPLYSRGYTSE